MERKGLLNVALVTGIAAVLPFAATAKATTLNPGDLLNSPPTVFDTLSGNPGTLVTANVGTISTASFTATIREAVYNPGIANTLDYYFQVVNSPASADAIGRVTDRSFDNFATNVFLRTDNAGGGGAAGFTASTIAPIAIDRDISGQTVGWNFLKGEVPALGAGKTSEILVVRVNSSNFSSNGQFNAIDGSVGSTVSLAPQESRPPSNVPEPGSLGLLGTGLAVLLFGLRRRYRAAHNG